MSFDLDFYQTEDQNLLSNEARKYFESNPLFEISDTEDGGFQAWYQNESTGVYFSFEENMPDEEEDEDIEYDITKGYIKTNISFNINYTRPTYFALEAMPIVTEFAQIVDLITFDPQADKIITSDTLEPDFLIQSWLKGNQFSVEVIRGEGAYIPYVPQEKTNYVWKFNTVVDKLQEDLGYNYFVPKIFFLKKDEDSAVLTATTWPECIPQVLPKCDYIIISQRHRGFLKFIRKKQTDILKSEQVRDEMKDYLQIFDGPVEDLLILHPEQQAGAKTIFDSMESDPYEGYEVISSDSIVDIEG